MGRSSPSFSKSSSAVAAIAAASKVGSASLRIRVVVKNGAKRTLRWTRMHGRSLAAEVLDHAVGELPDRRDDLCGLSEVALVGRLVAVSPGHPRRVVDVRAALPATETAEVRAHGGAELRNQPRLLCRGQVPNGVDVEGGQSSLDAGADAPDRVGRTVDP